MESIDQSFESDTPEQPNAVQQRFYRQPEEPNLLVIGILTLAQEFNP